MPRWGSLPPPQAIDRRVLQNPAFLLGRAARPILAVLRAGPRGACLGALFLCATVAPAVTAQQPAPRTAADSASKRAAPTLQTVNVSVTRDAVRSPFELPFAVSVAPLSARPALRRTGVSELLLGIPGVQVQDRANPSQDQRIALRGFGARSAFGVRGVRVLRDGVPLSLPDGQTPTDWLDLETVDQVDVVRGTAAALYGNAAGGVINMRSRAPAPQPFSAQARLWDGGGMTRGNVQLSGSQTDSTGNWQRASWLLSATRTAGNGPRTWSRLDASSLFARTLATVAGTRWELQGTHYDAPRAENTGALTAAELSRDPRLPDSLNITRRSRKAARQSQLALLAERDVAGGTVRASVFGASRTLDNPLPFAIVAVDRQVLGGGVHGSWRLPATAWPLRLGAGVDAQAQVDDRYNYENCAAVAPNAPPTVQCPASRTERGAIRLDQQERATGVGGYGRVEVEAPHGIFASAALRYDQVAFRVNDRFVTATNLNDSGMRTLGAVSPLVGLTWRARPLWSLFANLSTAFETPTVTELTNQADGAAGLNAQLEPQRTRTMEVGTQAVLWQHVRADLALFRATVLDELVPFDVPNQPGRRAFRNAGRSTRTGAETSVRGQWRAVDVGAAYTWSTFRFDRYDVGTVSFAGKRIPGVPEHYLQAFTTARARALWSTVEYTAASRASANDAATVYGAGYSVWNWRAGYDAPAVRGVRLQPTVSLENAFDRRYASSLVVNATRNRYFEPGLPRRVSFLLSLSWE